ncbi:MutS family DNA mismatch repair protein [Clostridium sp. BJN0001]|uniref:MutS family DNA mismatch repair protein n=1 Tax=Clostridium sp. BJN0001 TaxID=2930219 RepID=UPI001FD34E7F|nr:MutS family DNA mismatch repair protein [Clostridium sp. BJN0001]
MDSTKKIYSDNVKMYKDIYENIERKIKTLVWMRIVTVLIDVSLAFYFYKIDKFNAMVISLFFLTGIFIVMMIVHRKLFQKKKRNRILIDINKDGIKRIDGKFDEFKDDGSEYIDENHNYSYDLDIFGKRSLFQYINTTVTKGGRKKLSEILKLNTKKICKEDILKRQESVKEIADKIKFRQAIMVEGKMREKKDFKIEDLLSWAESSDKNFQYFKLIIAFICIAVTFETIFLIMINKINLSFIILDLIVNYFIVRSLTLSMKRDFKILESSYNSITDYFEIISIIEKEEFKSKYLKYLKEKLVNSNENSKIEIKKFSSVLSWLENSNYNAYYFILNTVFFSDVFIAYNLYSWRKKNGKRIRSWLDVISEIDMLSSISNIAFENKDFIYPEILDKNEVEGSLIGHPLIKKGCVKNSFSLRGKDKTALITGSNMSGKSTFLRTIGINLLLSYIGSPVCADRFSCGIMNIYTCMRTKDNLEESISSFYAEILRIKEILEACKKGDSVFFILDEIFKGTNSKDRHIGAYYLIKQLINKGAHGLVSTHDLELCDMGDQDLGVVNYNFREYYDNDKIKFDYKLRKGKSTTSNAIHLMKIAGIDILKN